ncbi:hypothetical protein GCM10010121_041600 [Streptomyces brasiliensis]|uniref:Uncharacterized protein n=1 Tax=Streptomyces brasiliensis TaxID=1954 RepID=A0A917NT06_9ACTN|nr:hypothetical protein GCM10010121_041600 [Streptomyces brasiliensis]
MGGTSGPGGRLRPRARSRFAVRSFSITVVTVLVPALVMVGGEPQASVSRIAETPPACALVLVVGHLPMPGRRGAGARARLAQAYFTHVLCESGDRAERWALRREAYRTLAVARTRHRPVRRRTAHPRPAHRGHGRRRDRPRCIVDTITACTAHLDDTGRLTPRHTVPPVAVDASEWRPSPDPHPHRRVVRPRCPASRRRIRAHRRQLRRARARRPGARLRDAVDQVVADQYVVDQFAAPGVDAGVALRRRYPCAAAPARGGRPITTALAPHAPYTVTDADLAATAELAGEHGLPVHTSFAAVSRAPFTKILPFKARMGWAVPCLSSYDNDFNRDFEVTLERDGALVERPGLSCFLREYDRIFHTYSAHDRALDGLGSTDSLLDLTALGRTSTGSDRVRYHDEYEN